MPKVVPLKLVGGRILGFGDLDSNPGRFGIFWIIESEKPRILQSLKMFISSFFSLFRTNSSICIYFNSQTQSSSSGGGGARQVYVLYPNYTLPDLSFLQDHATELDLSNVFLWPQKFEPSPVVEQAPPLVENKTDSGAGNGTARGRPMSCVDIDTLKRKGNVSPY